MKHLVFVFLFLCSLSFGYSQTIHHKDALTILGDSLIEKGDYKKAIAIRKQAINEHKNSSKDYKTYLKAKYFHAKSCDYEYESYSYYKPDKIITQKVQARYLDSALQSAIKARDLLGTMDQPDRKFQFHVQNRIYHQTAYLGDWEHALEQVEIGYEFMKDTLTSADKAFVDLIYDIGYIYNQLGDYSKSVENYQVSLDFYRDIIGENNHDVALSYNNIAVQYKYLGLRRKELESLHKAEAIWENLNEESVKIFLYTCYGNLFYWYSYYGDFDKAEEYISKKDKLRTLAKRRNIDGFFRNKEEVYKDKLSEWNDLMLHYSRKKDTIKTIFYVENILKTDRPNHKLSSFEINTLSGAFKLYASLLGNNNPEKALEMIDKAIEIQQKYKSVFYTKPFGFQLTKVELLLKSKKYVEANLLLYDLNNLQDLKEINNKFNLAILNAKTAQALHENKKAKTNFDAAYLLLKSSDDEMEQSEVQGLKPLISFEIIEGFLAMGDFYIQLFKDENNKQHLKEATQRYFLASKIYNQLYLGQRYNERLFSMYNGINERLLQLVNLPGLRDDDLLPEIMNTIENNGSKLTWSRFLFSHKRQEAPVSEVFISQEDDVKAQLNFYQNALLEADGSSIEKLALWKDKIYGLKANLIKIQDSIKQENNTYYQLNVKNFDVSVLQKTLKKDELILKYVLTDKHLYAFLISENSIELLPQTDRGKALSALKKCLEDLKQRSPNYKVSVKEMHALLFNDIDLKAFKKLIIIPDGALNYFPFEALLLDKRMPSVSYASSLLLYQEQKKIAPSFETPYIGAFSASSSIKKLPRASAEVNAILKIFNGKGHLNASKKEFLQNVDDFNILHLAMHSNMHESNPEFSSLNFYGDSNNQLFISELYNESLDADMAVLSACDTGSGFYEDGEGVISLSRALNYAGVPSTVMSLWKVDDEATAKIMAYFYEQLKLGKTKDEALKKAKLEYLKHTDDHLLRHPYYWSGFVISGNTDALVAKKNNWVYVAILPFFMLGFFRKRLIHFFKK